MYADIFQRYKWEKELKWVNIAENLYINKTHKFFNVIRCFVTNLINKTDFIKRTVILSGTSVRKVNL